MTKLTNDNFKAGPPNEATEFINLINDLASGGIACYLEFNNSAGDRLCFIFFQLK